MTLWDYIHFFRWTIVHLLVQHLWLFAASLVGALLLGVILGVLVHRIRPLGVLVPVINTLQATPEIVLLAMSIPFLGIGYSGALIPLFVKGVLPVMRNTMSGLASVDPGVSEAARGLGMSSRQVLFRVELVAALPVILAGMRVSAIMLVSVITLTAYIGIESLGTLILQGISRMDANPLIVGAGLAAGLAVAMNQMMLAAERFAARRVGVGA